MKKKKCFALYLVAVIISVVGWIFVFASASGMLSPWWRIPALAAVIPAVAFLPLARLWKGFLSLKSLWINGLIGFFVTTGILAGTGVFMNMIESSSRPPEKRRFAIERVYRTEHRESRRVGRRYLATGKKFYRYHLEVSAPDGRRSELPVSLAEYNKLRRRDSVTLTVHHGFLGADYIRKE